MGYPAQNLSEILIPPSSQELRHLLSIQNDDVCFDQETQIPDSSSSNSHILKNLIKVKTDRESKKRANLRPRRPNILTNLIKVKTDEEYTKRANLRSRLHNNFRKIVRVIIMRKSIRKKKEFLKIDEKIYPPESFQELKKFIIKNKKILGPFAELKKKETRKIEAENDKKCNPFVNLYGLRAYFFNPVIKFAFHLYVDYLLYVRVLGC